MQNGLYLTLNVTLRLSRYKMTYFRTLFFRWVTSMLFDIKIVAGRIFTLVNTLIRMESAKSCSKHIGLKLAWLRVKQGLLILAQIWYTTRLCRRLILCCKRSELVRVLFTSNTFHNHLHIPLHGNNNSPPPLVRIDRVTNTGVLFIISISFNLLPQVNEHPIENRVAHGNLFLSSNLHQHMLMIPISYLFFFFLKTFQMP